MNVNSKKNNLVTILGSFTFVVLNLITSPAISSAENNKPAEAEQIRKTATQIKAIVRTLTEAKTECETLKLLLSNQFNIEFAMDQVGRKGDQKSFDLLKTDYYENRAQIEVQFSKILSFLKISLFPHDVGRWTNVNYTEILGLEMITAIETPVSNAQRLFSHAHGLFSKSFKMSDFILPRNTPLVEASTFQDTLLKAKESLDQAYLKINEVDINFNLKLDSLDGVQRPPVETETPANKATSNFLNRY